MIDSFFNPSQHFQNMSNWFDWSKSFNLSNLMPQFNLNKVWELNKKNISSASNINNSFNDATTAIADKQASMIKENAENLTNAFKAMSQSNMTPQKLLEIQGEFCQKATAQNMKHAKELGEMYTKVSMKLIETCSEQIKKNLNECCGSRNDFCESNTTSTK
ncbi:MAG: phasin family protein [Rickettsiales bacterium]|nr:phasin family protein [Rickettsiales bacterium]